MFPLSTILRHKKIVLKTCPGFLWLPMFLEELICVASCIGCSPGFGGNWLAHEEEPGKHDPHCTCAGVVGEDLKES